jgi:tetratricopeptide (TPR) repeat protein
MKRSVVQFLLPLAIVLASLSSSEAVDTIYLDSGQTVPGTITGFSKDVIKVKQGSREQEIPVNTVVTVNWSAEPTELKNARASEKAGNLEKAMELYEQVKADSGSLSKDALTDIDYLMARANARIALTDPSKLDAAIKGLEDFKAANRDHFRYYELHEYLGKLYGAKGETAKATATFNEMKSSPYEDFKMAAQILSADVLFEGGDVAGAQREYSAVANMQATTPQEVNRRNEARLGLALCQIKQGQADQAVNIAESVIEDTDPTQSNVQAQAFLRKGDALVALDQQQQAVIAYLTVDLLFANEPQQHAEALYQLSKLWSQVGKADRASDALARLKNQYPNSQWAAATN